MALKIGVSARLYHPQAGAKGLQAKTLHYLEQSVAHWLMSREALVLMIPTVDQDGLVHRSEIHLADYAQALDALVLQGGADVSPATYGEEPLESRWAGDRARDVYEIELLHAFIDAGKPVLGICRGAQLINVAFGGTLYQDVGTQMKGSLAHVSEAYEKNTHEMRIEPGSRLAQLYPGLERARINSIHHQSIKSVGHGLAVEARAVPDGVIEAVRATRRGYVRGVQWHPEFHPPGGAELLDSRPLLDEFLRAAQG